MHTSLIFRDVTFTTWTRFGIGFDPLLIHRDIFPTNEIIPLFIEITIQGSVSLGRTLQTEMGITRLTMNIHLTEFRDRIEKLNGLVAPFPRAPSIEWTPFNDPCCQEPFIFFKGVAFQKVFHILLS